MMAPLRDGVSNAAVVSAKLKLFVFGGTTIHRDKVSKVGSFAFSPSLAFLTSFLSTSQFLTNYSH